MKTYITTFVLFLATLVGSLMGQNTIPTTEDGWRTYACETHLYVITAPGMGSRETPMEEVKMLQHFIIIYAHFVGQPKIMYPMLDRGVDGIHRSLTQASLEKVEAHLGKKLTTTIANDLLAQWCEKKEGPKSPRGVLDPTIETPQRFGDAENRDSIGNDANPSDYVGDTPSINPDETTDSFSIAGMTVDGLVLVFKSSANDSTGSFGYFTAPIWSPEHPDGDTIVTAYDSTWTLWIDGQPIAQNTVHTNHHKSDSLGQKKVSASSPTVMWDSLRGNTILLDTGQKGSLYIPFGECSKKKIEGMQGYTLATSVDSLKVGRWDLVLHGDTIQSGTLPENFKTLAMRADEIADSLAREEWVDDLPTTTLTASVGVNGMILPWAVGLRTVNIPHQFGGAKIDEMLLKRSTCGIAWGVTAGFTTGRNLAGIPLEASMRSTLFSGGVVAKGMYETRISLEGLVGFGKINKTYSTYYGSLEEGLGYGHPYENESKSFAGFIFSADQSFGSWSGSTRVVYVKPKFERAKYFAQTSLLRNFTNSKFSVGATSWVYQSWVSKLGFHAGPSVQAKFLGGDLSAYAVFDPQHLVFNPKGQRGQMGYGVSYAHTLYKK